MTFLYSKKKGASLPAVILVTATLIILVTAVSDLVYQWFRIVKGQEYDEYACIASESTIERAFLDIYNKIDSVKVPGFATGISFTDLDQFGKAVCDKLNPTVPVKYSDVEIMDKINADSNYTLKYVKTEADSSFSDCVDITIGVTANSGIRNGIYVTALKPVYAQRKFRVKKPNKLQLGGAIYTIGDLYANGSGTIANIDGDAFVFGSGVKYKMEPKQYYYGGIYAVNGATLNLMQNAYTNSFIRTGMYSNVSDKSKIDVYLDAVALSIQGFGSGDKIVLRQNAYTFDDLELDGEDSVIALNGNYYGLNSGNSAQHDASSAVLNAAPVHWMYSKPSLLSRIVINGDIMINGGAFKIDPSNGKTKFELENGSMAWAKNGTDGYDIYHAIPSYKEYDDSNTTLGADYFTKDYQSSLGYYNAGHTVGSKALFGGFLNYFQVWSPVSSTNIDSWLGEIESTRMADKNHYSSTIPVKISGFANYLVAANDRMYVQDKAIGSSDFKPIKYKSDLPMLLQDRSDCKTYWDDIASVTSTDASNWVKYYTTPTTHVDGVPDETVTAKLDSLSKYLYDGLSVFAGRNYPVNPNGSVKVGSGSSSEILPYFKMGDTGKPVFLTWFDEIDGKCSGIGVEPAKHILRYTNDIVGPYTTGYANICNEITAAPDDYYLVINDKPSNEIIINKNFHGLIITKGRVTVQGNVTITGCIIASGINYDSSNKIVSSAECDPTTLVPTNLPLISDTNVNKLDTGVYAGVNFDVGSRSTVKFPGREDLLNNILSKTNVDLSGIF